jgi:chromosome segregation ATPase
VGDLVELTGRFARLLEQARSAVVFTGAGISTESGIPDFRSPGTGLWNKIKPIEFQDFLAREDMIQMVEQQIPQFGKYESALADVREEIRRHREYMDFQMAQRERLMKNWTELAEEQEQRIKEHESLMDKYLEHYQLNKRALASLQEFQERLQREQHQAEELQRLAENRQRAAMEKLHTDYEQRWQKQGLEWQPQIESLKRDIATLQNNIAQLKKFNQTVEDRIEMILQIIEEDVQSRAVSVQEWQDRFEQLASGRT